ncbi:hypothetical protein BDD12DRAFT_809297 [Trichophaea hybrida]|nr:hypothetical protein BDD12DRAFT_809297 [Trichophaea hybrida]
MFALTIRLNVLSSLAFLVNGAAWPAPGPAPTPVGYGLPMEGISPRTTPKARIKGRYAGHELFERADNPLSICGYVSGVRSSSVTCPGGRSCFYNSPISAAGCCYYSSDTPAACGQYTGCVPSSSLSACTGTCASDGLIIKCSNSAAPYCFTFAFPGYNNIGCATVSGSQNVLFTYSGQATDISAGPSQVQTSVVTATVTASASGGEEAGLGTNPTSTSSSSGSSSSNNSSSKKGGSNIGAIAGGAVGGLAILALFILALVWLLRRNKKSKTAAAATVTAVGAGGMQQPKPFDGVYDPQQPMSPAPQYNPAPGGFYDQAGTIPQKHEYSQQPGIQPPVGYSEISAAPPTQYQQPQYQQPPPPPAQPIYEAPTTQH